MKYSMLTFSTKYSRVPKRRIALADQNLMIESGLEPVIIHKEAYEIILGAFHIQTTKLGLKLLACNILPDHAHLLIGYNSPEVSKYVRQIKGYSAFVYNKQFKRTVTGGGQQNTLRGRKYSQTNITSSNHKESSIRYINNNHYKHAEKRGKRIITDYNTHLKHKLAEYGCL